MLGLKIRKLADRSEGQREIAYDPVTGAKLLVNPATGQPEPWPLAGVEIVDEAPVACKLPTTFVAGGVAEGWIELEGAQVVHRPGGPAARPWQVTHTFEQADAIVIHCLAGDVRYRVAHQPDKYDDPNEPAGTRVDWFYGVELEG